MSTRHSSERFTFFRMGVRWPSGQCTFLIRHCEKRHYPKIVDGKVYSETKRNKRRGNLPSLVENKEVFNISTKVILQRTHSREIAAGMWQRLTWSMLNIFLTEPRNDCEAQRSYEVWCKWRLIQNARLQQRIETIL